MNSLGHTCV